METRVKKSEVEFGKGITPESLAILFRNNLILDRAADGEYNGSTGKVTVSKGKIGNGCYLFVEVNFEDNQGNDVQLKYSNELHPKNYYIRKLFSDFKIDFRGEKLELDALSNTAVKIIVKNNGPYCNVIGIEPLKNEQLTRANYANRLGYEEDVKVNLDDDDSDFNLDLDDDDSDFDLDFDDELFVDLEED